MTPLLSSPDHYLQGLHAMKTGDAKRLWKEAIKNHWQCKCAYCHNTFDAADLTLDHVTPRSRGGASLTNNLVPACVRCNRAKGTRNWLDFMRDTFGCIPEREEAVYSWIRI